MSVIRHALMPVFAVGRAIVLNGEISTTARLLYVLMLATVDLDDAPDVAALLGLEESALAPFLDELVRAGVVEFQSVGTDIVASVQELARG
jgi:predicted ArsR family transcriptional regulator